MEKNCGVDVTHRSFIHLVNTDCIRCHVATQGCKDKGDAWGTEEQAALCGGGGMEAPGRLS